MGHYRQRNRMAQLPRSEPTPNPACWYDPRCIKGLSSQHKGHNGKTAQLKAHIRTLEGTTKGHGALESPPGIKPKSPPNRDIGTFVPNVNAKAFVPWASPLPVPPPLTEVQIAERKGMAPSPSAPQPTTWGNVGLAALHKQKAELAAKNSDLKAANDDLKAANDDLKAANDALHKQKAELAAKNNHLDAQITTLLGHIHMNVDSDQTTRIAHLEAELEKRDAELKALREALGASQWREQRAAAAVMKIAW